jgi:serine/threonine-protein kinase RsbW
MKKVIQIPSKIENLRKVEKIIDEISGEFHIGEDLYGNILIASLEATNNAIMHGNKLDESKNVTIAFNLEGNTLFVRVDDEGNGFDYQHIPDPTAPENIENVNGRGIFLMEKLSDKINFSRNGATVELEFNVK